MIARSGDRLAIAGPLTVDSARAILEEGSAHLGEIKTIDLAGVTEVDSSAVSVILEWQREAARRSNAGLRFENLPGNLRNLVDLYGVAELIRQ